MSHIILSSSTYTGTPYAQILVSLLFSQLCPDVKNDVMHFFSTENIKHGSSPLSTKDRFQDPQWIPEVADSTKRHAFFTI